MKDLTNILSLKRRHDDIVKDMKSLLEGRVERSSENINKLNTDVESYLIGVEELQEFCVENKASKELVEQCVGFANDGAVFENAVLNFSVSNRLNESRFGFMNPFDEDDYSETQTLPDVEVTKSEQEKKGPVIIGLKLWNQKKKNKAYFDGDTVCAGQVFYPGDEIECSPVRLFSKQDLYSKTIRDVAFEVDKQKGVYGIPFGYVSYFKNSLETKKHPNAEYESFQDENGNYFIRILAIDKIPTNAEIILASDETDFANEIHPYDFRYDKPNTETIYKAKYKFA